MILTDRVLLTLGWAAVIACVALQAYRHALWFQLGDPYPSQVAHVR